LERPRIQEQSKHYSGPLTYMATGRIKMLLIDWEYDVTIGKLYCYENLILRFSESWGKKLVDEKRTKGEVLHPPL
jgi:hypothetical protein